MQRYAPFRSYSMIVVATTAIFYWSSASANAQILTQPDGQNGTYLAAKSGTGKITRLNLKGYGDYGMLAQANFDYLKFFASIKSSANLVRIWLPYHFADGLSQFPKTKVENKQKRKIGNTYDLTSFNKDFFTRLSGFVNEANNNGIVVQVCLFDENQFEKDTNKNRWNHSPYNPNNQSVNSQALQYLKHRSDFIKIAGRNINDTNDYSCWTINESFARKVVSTLGNYPNVIYEIMNEPDVDYDASGFNDLGIAAFHDAIIKTLREEFAKTDTAGLPIYNGSKLISVNISSDKTSIHYNQADIVSIHLPASWDSNSDFKKEKDLKWIFSLKIPLIISNDGQKTQSYQNFDKDKEARATDAKNLITQFKAIRGQAGYLHFEFLDKDINKVWPFVPDPIRNPNNVPNYEPMASRIDNAILKLLSKL